MSVQYLPIGYHVYGSIPRRALKAHSEKKTWLEARKACQMDGGDLIVVDTPLVNDWLASMNKTMGRLWVGATDEVRMITGKQGQVGQ